MREVDEGRTAHSATASLQAGTGAQGFRCAGRGPSQGSAGALASGRREPATAAMGNWDSRPPVVGTKAWRAADRPLICGAMGEFDAQASIRR
jgi:hypothetical protein